MSEPDQNYALRPKRTTKGKYREMVGIGSSKKIDRVLIEEQEVAVPSNSKGKSRRILVLPIVVTDSGENVSNNEIEIEIMDGVSVSELGDEVELEISTSAATGDEQESESEPKAKQTADPSQHIDELLEKNDKLLESISEGPQFRKRKSKGAAGAEIVFTTQTIQEMINRPLTSEEEVQVQSKNGLGCFSI